MPDRRSDAALAILTAVVNPSLEAQLVAAFGRHDLGVSVVRRCVDVVELLAAAGTATASAALVSSDLRGLDREALAHLAECGVATVGLAVDESGERLLHQFDVGLVLPAGASPEQVAGALRAVTAAPVPAREPTLHVGAAGTTPTGADPSGDPGGGRVIAVWGPAGAPGRSTVALGLADALARRGVSSMIVDADPYGGSITTLTGMLDESPGITAACRAANAGALDVAVLAGCTRELVPGLRILTGLTQPTRWPELRPAALDVVLRLSRRLADVTVVDCGFCLEEDEELSYDTVAPRRNGSTLTSLRSADQILAVASADPVGLARMVRELARLAEVLDEPLPVLLSSGRLVVVLNRLRPGLLPGDPWAAAVQALERHGGIVPTAALPLDVAAADSAHGRGELLSEAAPQSALFRALERLAAALVVPAHEGVITRKRLRPLGLRRRAHLLDPAR